jgi:hypothetical protein
MLGQPNCCTRFEHERSVPRDDCRKFERVVQNEVSTELLEWLETEPEFLTQVVTGDKGWLMTLKPKGRVRKHDTCHNLEERRKVA